MVKNISTVKINASMEKVWNTITEPEKVKLWQFGSDLLTTWEINTKIEFITEWEGQTFKQWGTVLKFNPATHLKYNLFAPRPDLEDRPENYFIMSYNLTDENGITKLEIIQEDNRPNAIQEETQGEENPILKTLKEIAEQN
jgi:uncharacterized protein YndB with AHSA1/START domain